MPSGKGGLRKRSKSLLELTGSNATEDPNIQESADESPPPKDDNRASALEKKERRVKLSATISETLADRIRNIAYHARGGDLSAIIEEALQREADRVEKVENGGNEFPTRPSKELKRGRKVA